MKTSARSAVILSTALLLGWSGATLAAPARVSALATKTVKFADLDISTADGAAALYDRIAAAARAVCRGEEVKAINECKSRATANAVQGVGSPLLSALHRSTIEAVEGLVRR